MSDLGKRQTASDGWNPELELAYIALAAENGRLAAELADCRQVISDLTRFPIRNGDVDSDAVKLRARLAEQGRKRRKVKADKKFGSATCSFCGFAYHPGANPIDTICSIACRTAKAMCERAWA